MQSATKDNKKRKRETVIDHSVLNTFQKHVQTLVINSHSGNARRTRQRDGLIKNMVNNFSGQYKICKDMVVELLKVFLLENNDFYQSQNPSQIKYMIEQDVSTLYTSFIEVDGTVDLFKTKTVVDNWIKEVENCIEEILVKKEMEKVLHCKENDEKAYHNGIVTLVKRGKITQKDAIKVFKIQRRQLETILNLSVQQNDSTFTAPALHASTAGRKKLHTDEQLGLLKRLLERAEEVGCPVKKNDFAKVYKKVAEHVGNANRVSDEYIRKVRSELCGGKDNKSGECKINLADPRTIRRQEVLFDVRNCWGFIATTLACLFDINYNRLIPPGNMYNVDGLRIVMSSTDDMNAREVILLKAKFKRISQRAEWRVNRLEEKPHYLRCDWHTYVSADGDPNKTIYFLVLPFRNQTPSSKEFSIGSKGSEFLNPRDNLWAEDGLDKEAWEHIEGEEGDKQAALLKLVYVIPADKHQSISQTHILLVPEELKGEIVVEIMMKAFIKNVMNQQKKMEQEKERMKKRFEQEDDMSESENIDLYNNFSNPDIVVRGMYVYYNTIEFLIINKKKKKN